MSLLRRCNLTDTVSVYFDPGRPLKRLFGPPRKREECPGCDYCQLYIGNMSSPCITKNLVYRITCTTCHKVYIGETERRVRQRLHEHLVTQSSHVKRHFDTMHNGVFTYTWTILHCRLQHWHKRLFIESHYINQHAGNVMNGCVATIPTTVRTQPF